MNNLSSPCNLNSTIIRHLMPMSMPTSTSDHENYDPTFPDQPVVELYLPIWAKLPAFQDKPAFVWVEGDSDITRHNPALTYGQLNASADRVASRLKSTPPLRRGDVVVIMCPPGLELIEMIFGCQRAGICIIPILPLDTSFSHHHHHHLIRVLSQTKPKAAIATAQYIARVSEYVSTCTTGKKQQQQLPQLLQKLKWISTEDLKLSPSSRSPYSGTRAEEVYLIQYTSGATGIPKPVLVTAGSAAHNVRAARKAYDLHPNSTIASWLPQYHDCGLMFLLLTVVSGATCVLTSPNAFLKRPRLWLEMVSEFKATCTPVPSFALPLVVRRGGSGGVAGTGKQLAVRLGSLKNLILINEPIYGAAVEEFVEVFRCCGLEASAISPSYGLAENCTFVSTAWRPPSLSDTSSAGNFVLPTYKRLLPSARLDGDGDDVDMHIVVVNEETSSLVDDGVEGEIWVSSPSNCSGYLGHPSLTRDTFHSRLTCQTGRRYLRTGDRGVISGDERYLFVTGRSADLIRLPENDAIIHPHYIESAAYASFPKILRGGCVAAVERWRGSVAVVAELQRREKAQELRRVAEGIRKVVLEKERIEVEAVVLVVNGSVPKTTSGKLQRWLTREKLRKGELQVVMAMEVGDGDHGEGRRRYHEGTSSISKARVASEEEEDDNDGGEVAYSFSGDTSPRPRLVSFL